MPLCIYKTRFEKTGDKTPKSLISQWFRVSVSILVTLDGCGGRTRTCDLRVMRLSQGQNGAVSAAFCTICHHSLGGFSIVSVQPCPLFRILGQKWVRGCNIRRDWRTATLRHSPHYLSSYHKWCKNQRFVGVFVHHGSCLGLGDGAKVTTVVILIRCDGVAPR